MNINRSALTSNVVCGLPNVKDYIYKNRQRLLEERRLRLIQMDVNNSNNNNNVSPSPQNLNVRN